jgi:hypothetical protein
MNVDKETAPKAIGRLMNQENSGWDPVDLWAVDVDIANDMLSVLQFICESHCYPPELGCRKEIEAIWEAWRGARV